MKLRFILSFLVGMVLFEISNFSTPATSSVSLLPERQSLRIKLVDDNRALVTETRYLELQKGENSIYLNYPGVKIIPDSIHIQFVETPEKIKLLQLSTSLRDASSLTWQIYSEKEGRQLVRVSYLVEGLSASYSYIAEVGKGEDLVFLDGSLILQNQTGEEFTKATLTGKEGGRWRIDLKPEEKKRLPLFHSLSFPLQKVYLLDQEKYAKRVILRYHFINETGNPLFPGKIRVYQRKKEELTFLGEDRIEITNPGGKVDLLIGSVQDIKVERKLVEFSRMNLRRDNVGNVEVYDTREKYEIHLKNRKKEEVKLILREYIPYTWEMVNSEPADYVKEDAHHIRFEINLAPGEEKKIYYHIYRKNLFPRDRVKPLMSLQ